MSLTWQRIPSGVMTKKTLCAILTLMLASSLLLPGTASAGGTASSGTLQIASAPAGADVYVDGTFTDHVTPCALPVSAGTHTVELKIPGYETYANTGVQIDAAQTTILDGITQLPELIAADADHTLTVTTLADTVRWTDLAGMHAITVAQLKADAGTPVTLREAIEAVKNEPVENGHYRIEFDASLAGGTLHLFRQDGGTFISDEGFTQALSIEKRGDLTINGDINRDGVPDITLDPSLYGTPGTQKGADIELRAANVTLAGLFFHGGVTTDEHAYTFCTLSIRVPDHDTSKYDLENMRVLGCVFDHSMEIGTGPCGAYGYAAAGYGQAGTFNVKNIVFAGNTFEKASLFSFAGAGDEDYNVIDGYYVAANQFTDGGIGLLAADAHTWYVYGKDTPDGNGGTAGQIKYCEYNQLKNVYITGNDITINEDNSIRNIVFVNTANLGNSHNLVENVHIRNNRGRATGIHSGSGVGIGNVSVAEDEEFSYLKSGVRHNTADNTMRNVFVHNNEFVIGEDTSFEISNTGMCAPLCGMDGTGNTMSNIEVTGNRITSRRATAIIGTGSSTFHGLQGNDISHNSLLDVVFSGNTLTGTHDEQIIGGLAVAGYFNDMGSYDLPFHDNTTSGITLENNTISGYDSGIVLAGACGNSANGFSLENVDVTGNTIVCDTTGGYGIVAAGNVLKDYGGTACNGSTQCLLQNITITGNRITAPGGMLLAGTFVNSPVKKSIAGNRISTITVSGNTLVRLQDSGFHRQSIVAADIIREWGQIEPGTQLQDNACRDIAISGNTVTGFGWNAFNMSGTAGEYPIGYPAARILGELKTFADTGIGNDAVTWSWYGNAFSGNSGSFVVSGVPNTMELNNIYKCIRMNDKYCVMFDPGDGVRTGGGELIQSVAAGGAAVAPVVKPPQGYRFSGWDKDFSHIDAALTVRAVYSPAQAAQYTVSVSSGNTAYGTVSGGGTYSAGATATVRAVPRAGYRFIRWLEGASAVSTAAEYSFTVTGARALKAEFAKIGIPGYPKAVSASYNSIKLTWTAVAGANTYEIYRATSKTGTYARVGTAASAGYTNGGLTTNKTYYYKVRARCVAGGTATIGLYSAIVSARPVPSAPTGLKAARASSRSVRLTWKAVSGATKYEVWRATSKGGSYRKITVTAGKSYLNTSLTRGRTYFYKIKAYRLVGRTKVYGFWSAVASARPY